MPDAARASQSTFQLGNSFDSEAPEVVALFPYPLQIELESLTLRNVLPFNLVHHYLKV